MLKNFGVRLKEKLSELKLPKNHPQLEGIRHYYPLPIEGCSNNDLKEIQKFQDIQRLPELYKDVMRYIGKKSGDLFLGYDFVQFYLTSYNFRKLANSALASHNHKPLDETYYVFLNKQGVHHWFFSINDGDDPPVFSIAENSEEYDDPFQNGSIKVSDNLSGFMTKFIEERQNQQAQMDFLISFEKSNL